MVAAGGDERRRAEVGLDLEAEDAGVEGEGPVDVADVEVEVAGAQAGADLGGRRLAVDGREQRLEVERGRTTGVAEVGRPRLARAVGGQLDAVAVGVGQVDRLVGAVV